MDQKIMLQNFCDPEDERFKTPFSDGDFTYAIDGCIGVRIPKIEGFKEFLPFPSAATLVWEPRLQDGVWLDLPAYELPPKKPCHGCHGTGKVNTCPECDGEGELVFSNAFSNYGVECNTCHGEGFTWGIEITCPVCKGSGTIYRDGESRVVFGDDGNFCLNAFFLEKIKLLPAVKMFSAPTKGVFNFRFDGGCGVIMGMGK